MNLYQTTPNSVWYTDDPIFSSVSNKQIYYGFQVMNDRREIIGLFDKNEFIQYMMRSDNEDPWIRIIESNALPIKKTRVIERNKMNLKLRYKIMQRDGFACTICGNTSKESRLEVDHIIPISKGGRSTDDNLSTLCFMCNRGKSDL